MIGRHACGFILRTTAWLTCVGSDEASGTVHVAPISVPSWIRIPSLVQIPADSNSVAIPILANSSGVAENLEPYQALLNITAFLQVNVQFSIPVILFVSARVVAETSVWGAVSKGQLCVENVSAYVVAIVGQSNLASFTACDFEGLPVSHTLPTHDDLREWQATLTSDMRSSSIECEVRHTSNGVRQPQFPAHNVSSCSFCRGTCLRHTGRSSQRYPHHHTLLDSRAPPSLAFPPRSLH